jgi:superfamily I DNA/RNA helicase
MSYTPEQRGVIDASGRIIAVNAFAGTGKTYTLVGRAQAHPDERMLVCMLNRANAIEARERFPRNAYASTSHSLAFQTIGKHFSHKLGDIKPFQLLQMMDIPIGGRRQQEQAAFVVLATLRNFMTSADMAIDDHHVPAGESQRVGLAAYEVVKYAKALWNQQIDPNHSARLPHDGYLKIYQMSMPKLTEYQSILLDEAQDLNPVTLAIMEHQDHARLILVGDEHQSIYSFRASINALATIDADERFYLTQSFRFGSAIADTANTLLSTFKGETQALRGLGDDSAVGDFPSGIGHHAILCRTNAGIFDAAVDFINEYGNAPIAFAGGLRGYALDQLMDTYNLRNGELSDVRDSFIRSFGDFDELEAYAENVDDKELKSRCRVLDTYGKGVPKFVAMLRQMEAENPDHAVVTFSTAHKSKGLEWDYVRLWNDYTALVDKRGLPLTASNAGRVTDGMEPVDLEEVNLMYVAATRARKVLDTADSTLGVFLDRHAGMNRARQRRSNESQRSSDVGKLFDLGQVSRHSYPGLNK